MNAPLATGVQGFLARFEGLRARLPGDPVPRLAAAETLRTLGLPGRRDEAWHYTNLRPIAEAAFHEPLSAVADGAALLARVPRLGARLVFVDGRFRAELSDTPDGASLAPFAASGSFGALARPDRDPLAALNTMLAEDGAVITVPANTDGGTIMLVSLATAVPGCATAFHPRHRIRLGPAARLALVEVALGEGTYLHNPVSEIDIAEGASLTHVRLQDESPAAYHLATLYTAIAAGGFYDSFTLALGGRLARAELHAELTGPGAVAHLNAAQLLTGVQHARHHQRGAPRRAARHLAPDGEERARRPLPRRVPGPHRGRPRRAADRRLPDEPGAAAVARGRDRQQAGTGDFRRRREMQPRRHGGRTRRRAAVLPAQPRHPRPTQRAQCWCAPSWPRRSKRSPTTGARHMLEHAVTDWWERQAA